MILFSEVTVGVYTKVEIYLHIVRDFRHSELFTKKVRVGFLTLRSSCLHRF